MTWVDEVLDKLKGLPPGTTVFDGEVDTVEDQVISAELIPYVVVWVMPGATVRHRKSGRSHRQASSFQLTSVNLSRRGAQDVAAASRRLVEGSRIAGGLVRCVDSDWVRPDQDARTTDNDRVYYVAEQFSVTHLERP